MTRPAPADDARSLISDALRFLDRFGVVCVAWAVLLAVTAPRVDRPALLWGGLAAYAVYAVAAFRIRPRRVWWAAWTAVVAALELLAALAGTHGWGVVGGSAFVPLGAAALDGRRRALVATLAVIGAAVLVRPLFAEDFSVLVSLVYVATYTFGGVALAWLIRLVARGVEERGRLQRRLVEAEKRQAVAAERAEAAARLHDTVLQHLTAIGHADALEQARRRAARASADLRTFLRGSVHDGERLRAALDRAVTEAADGADVSFAAAGDRPLDGPGHALVAATAEAVRNAVRHARPPVRVYAELAADRATVFVSDRGDGFEPAAAPGDRLGVRESVVGRLERAGGTATLTSGPGGSEWTLSWRAGGEGGA